MCVKLVNLGKINATKEVLWYVIIIAQIGIDRAGNAPLKAWGSLTFEPRILNLSTRAAVLRDVLVAAHGAVVDAVLVAPGELIRVRLQLEEVVVRVLLVRVVPA